VHGGLHLHQAAIACASRSTSRISLSSPTIQAATRRQSHPGSRRRGPQPPPGLAPSSAPRARWSAPARSVLSRRRRRRKRRGRPAPARPIRARATSLAVTLDEVFSASHAPLSSIAIGSSWSMTQDRLRFQKVEIIARADGLDLLVSSGLKNGDRICLTATRLTGRGHGSPHAPNAAHAPPLPDALRDRYFSSPVIRHNSLTAHGKSHLLVHPQPRRRQPAHGGCHRHGPHLLGQAQKRDLPRDLHRFRLRAASPTPTPPPPKSSAASACPSRKPSSTSMASAACQLHRRRQHRRRPR
jgi:hypothetical protein